jgi:hypothetical protein
MNFMTESKSSIQTPPIPSATARHLMPFKCVRIEILDQGGGPVMLAPENGKGGGPAVASGFLLRDEGATYLYTCWHVVTGISLTNPVLPGASVMQRRSRLKVSMQANDFKMGGAVVTTGGTETFEIDLYDTSGQSQGPLWEQDEQSNPNANLAMANLNEPFWHDIVRIRLPDEVKTSTIQNLAPQDVWPHMIAPGDPLLLVGYPYGYSAKLLSPTPIVLKRNVAAIQRDSPRREILIDGVGAAGMSGGPVFCEHEDRLYLFGVYTGIIYPDAAEGVSPERTTALGTVCQMNLLYGALKLARPTNS